MSEIKRCENCGNENIEIINRYKGHYLCGKCGRDTEKLYEIEHDAEIRNKAIDDAIEASAKAICAGCGYLDGYKCTYKGANCGVSKPMLESVVKALEQLKKQTDC